VDFCDFFTLFSVTGYYIIQDNFAVANVDFQQANADRLANDMAIYRQAVITSASANPTATGKLASLAFPLGYADKGLWDHMIEANGNIWIFQKEKIALKI